MYTSDWGPELWYILHTCSVKMSEQNYVYLKNMFALLTVLIPCNACKIHYNDYYNSGAYHRIFNKYSCIEYVANLHNKVNKRHKKIQWNINDVIRFYNVNVIYNYKILKFLLICEKYANFCGYSQQFNNFANSLMMIYPDPKMSFKLANYNGNKYKYYLTLTSNIKVKKFPLTYIVKFSPLITKNFTNCSEIVNTYNNAELSKISKSEILYNVNENSQILFKYKLIKNKNYKYNLQVNLITYKSNKQKKPELEVYLKGDNKIIYKTKLSNFKLKNKINFKFANKYDYIDVVLIPNSNYILDLKNNYFELV